jgi:formylmethanofuran dehydrogenase subunit E
MLDLETLLRTTAARHDHLCPRQVLGVRIGLAGANALGLTLPRKDKRLLVITETDGCFVDGIEVTTGVSIGHRTLRVIDFGKIAATFVDTRDQRAIRVSPQLDVRSKASLYAQHETCPYEAQLIAYETMPTQELLSIKEVVLSTPLQTILSQPGLRIDCDICGEEIINEREIHLGEKVLCRDCAGYGYYTSVGAPIVNDNRHNPR